MLRWRTEQVEEVTVLVIAGEIDMTSAPLLRHVLDGLDRSRPILLDLSGIDYLDARGVRVLEEFCRTCRRLRVPVAVCAAPTGVRRVLDVVGFARIAPVASSQAEALAELRRKGGVEPPATAS